MAQISRFLADTCDLVFGCIISLQHVRDGRKSFPVVCVQMLQCKRRKLLWFFSVIVNGRGEIPFPDCGEINTKLIVKVYTDICGKLWGRKPWIYTGKKTDLLSGDGTDPGKAGVDRLGYRHWLCTKQGMKLGFWNCERICFFHGVRDEIVPSGQHFPDRTHLGGDMFDAVNDRSVWSTENNIAVFAHDLHDQILAAKIAKLIQMLDCKMNDPF